VGCPSVFNQTWYDREIVFVKQWRGVEPAHRNPASPRIFEDSQEAPLRLRRVHLNYPRNSYDRTTVSLSSYDSVKCLERRARTARVIEA
jgi:hypothetical protein